MGGPPTCDGTVTRPNTPPGSSNPGVADGDARTDTSVLYPGDDAAAGEDYPSLPKVMSGGEEAHHFAERQEELGKF